MFRFLTWSLLRAQYDIRTPDAIRAATALIGAKGIISNDHGLLRLEPELKIWLLE